MYIMVHYSFLTFYLHLFSWADYPSRKDREIYRDGNSSSKFWLVRTTALIDPLPGYVSLDYLTAKDGKSCVISDCMIENTFIDENRGPSLQALVSAGNTDESMTTALFVDSIQYVPTIPNGAILRFTPFFPSDYFIAWPSVRDGKERLEFGLLSLSPPYTVTALDVQVPYYWNGAGYFQQEARLVQLDADRIFAIFTARFTQQSPFTQIYVILTFNRSNGWFAVGSPKWIDYGRDVHSKNFVPLVFANSVYLLPSIDPLVVLRLHPNDVDNVGTVTVVHEGTPSQLPWEEAYGTHIRSGTAAVQVGDLYLLFFHTRVTGHAQGVDVNPGDHFFMGAMTLCPHPPFLIRSTSRFPLEINFSLYEVPWLNKVLGVRCTRTRFNLLNSYHI